MDKMCWPIQNQTFRQNKQIQLGPLHVSYQVFWNIKAHHVLSDIQVTDPMVVRLLFKDTLYSLSNSRFAVTKSVVQIHNAAI